MWGSQGMNDKRQAFWDGHWGSSECRGGNGILNDCSKKMSQEAADDEGLNQGSSDRGAVMEMAGRCGWVGDTQLAKTQWSIGWGCGGRDQRERLYEEIGEFLNLFGEK